MSYSNQSTDQELIVGCREGHPLAQKAIYQRYFGKMFGIALRYTKHQEEAIEILNNAFLKVFTCLHKYEDQNNLAGWIAKIVFNTAIDFVRQHVKYKQVMDFEVQQDAPTHNDGLSHLQAEDLYKLIQQLPTASRTVFSLYVLEGYRHKEIGEMLNITEGTSKWHLAYARQELQKMLQTQYKTEKKNNSDGKFRIVFS
jgi:RNA polymerase sigma factor (sigma-70 family)